MREIKFRAWDKSKRQFLFFELFESHRDNSGRLYIERYGKVYEEDLVVEQHTGLKDVDGKEIYEGDIFRIEIEGEHGNERAYAIVTYIQEWCMFASLLSEEYKNFLIDGINAIDEKMFWTFTLEDAIDQQIIGNIHENQELIK